MPRLATSGCAAPNTISTSAAAALATHTFWPTSRKPKPSCVIRVCWLAASVPACSSDSAKAPTARSARERPQPARLLLVGAVRQQRLGDERVVDREDHRDRGAGPRHDLDGERVGDVVEAAPPHASGIVTPIRPMAPARATRSRGKASDSSIAAARGATSSSAKRRTSSSEGLLGRR